jgi:REP-associated tyrosine transposase
VPRILRTALPAGFFHVTARGVDGTAIVRDDDDRLEYLRLAAATVRRHDWSCYAFCLMTTHVHFILEALQAQMSSGVQWLHGVYAQRFNRRHGRDGHLFGGRFASWVIEDEEHLVNACLYVVANPVRAGLCDNPREWRWSGLARRLPV